MGYLNGWTLVQSTDPNLRGSVELDLERRGVKRPAAATRQLGAEMNETYDPSTFGGISQDIPGYASL